MKTKLLAAITALSGVWFSSGALAAACADAVPVLLSSMAAGFTCTDAFDSDLQFTFDAASGFPADTTFSLQESEAGGIDFYSVNLAFPGAGGLSSAASFTYDLTVLNTELIVAANEDSTLTKGIGEINYNVTKDITSGGAPVLSLTSKDGSPDPASGEKPFPAPETTIHVVDTFTPGTGVAFWTANINSFQVQPPTRTPEPATLALLGLGLLGIVAFRKRSD